MSDQKSQISWLQHGEEYADGGLGIVSWGLTGSTEEDMDGLSLEELDNRLYSRVKRVLRCHSAGFGLENWGGSPVKLVSPFYDCRMIGESFQEATPEDYLGGFNPLITGKHPHASEGTTRWSVSPDLSRDRGKIQA